MSSKNVYRALASRGTIYCWLCHKPIQEEKHFSQDHIRPKSKGGKGLSNLRPAHRWCNTARADDPSDEWVNVLYPETDWITPDVLAAADEAFLGVVGDTLTHPKEVETNIREVFNG